MLKENIFMSGLTPVVAIINKKISPVMEIITFVPPQLNSKCSVYIRVFLASDFVNFINKIA